MPDTSAGAADRLLWSSRIAGKRPLPYLIYRGRVLWLYHRDAMTAAAERARTCSKRQQVKPFRIPGHERLLWMVKGNDGPNVEPRESSALV
jgi:hypothetical protein